MLEFQEVVLSSTTAEDFDIIDGICRFTLQPGEFVSGDRAVRLRQIDHLPAGRSAFDRARTGEIRVGGRVASTGGAATAAICRSAICCSHGAPSRDNLRLPMEVRGRMSSRAEMDAPRRKRRLRHGRSVRLGR